ncbi:MAG TPA: ferritin-like domain-containing protein [Flavitalea sp.]|nr:ferritin-like domain-containing protein [Flavitalea sp.]
METTQKWISHFQTNRTKQRVDWQLLPAISKHEMETILYSLQAWQLGETSDGSHLLKVAEKYAVRFNDPHYVESVRLFIKEEQKHGNHLGEYLNRIGQPKVMKDWGDTLFRFIRYFNSSIELWTLSVIVVESTAQIFYQSLKDATGCQLLKQICTDILVDEAYHIEFQMERLQKLYDSKSGFTKFLFSKLSSVFFFITVTVVWLAHRKVFVAGGNNLIKYLTKMKYKHAKTIKRLTIHPDHKVNAPLSISV